MSCAACGENAKIVARGWCRNCYNRWYHRGTTSYAPKPEKVACSVGGCSDLVIAKGMCDKHYRRVKLHGDPEHGSSIDWGKRSKHPLYHSWKWMRRHKTGTPVCKEWLNDFWTYAFDVGEKPSKKHKLFRANDRFPLGPENFVWKESVVQRVDGEDEKTYQNRAHKVYRKVREEAFAGYDLKKNYGMSYNEYCRLSEDQDHKCKICGQEESTKIRGKVIRLAVDHCHDTGQVRGLLCNNCNRGLGLLGDTIDRLQSAQRYLQKAIWNERPI